MKGCSNLCAKWCSNKVVDGKIGKRKYKFKYLWDNKEVFETAGKIIIAYDDDPSGSAMSEELSRRIGRDKVLTVHYRGL